ncbi:hypothetical protein [Synechocystis sp. PCC 7509]|uniref:hypothetical protein n=1 Tax=Synechocystis sp. PCC 7509 TaxID=927677 RepID=UPI0002ACABDF|nr:hypothetical protein [Synechocystis sp. PCC 7509]
MVEQINRDIAALEATVKAIAIELENAYISYLTSLGQGVTKQLMLASYHVCTQGYPKQFVSLSFNKRQQLQQDILKLTQKAAEQLLKHTQTEHPLEFSFLAEEEATPISFSNPVELIKWQFQVENAIAQTLKTLSSQTNSVLQEAQILPNNLPLAPLLEAATSSPDDTPEVITGLPNLLNLLIETDSDNEAQESNVTQIVAIHLRLIDIEFADSTVRAKRNQLRNLSGKVGKLEREYQKKQREKDVAEAESAWRGSWFES